MRRGEGEGKGLRCSWFRSAKFSSSVLWHLYPFTSRVAPYRNPAGNTLYHIIQQQSVSLLKERFTNFLAFDGARARFDQWTPTAKTIYAHFAPIADLFAKNSNTKFGVESGVVLVVKSLDRTC